MHSKDTLDSLIVWLLVFKRLLLSILQLQCSSDKYIQGQWSTNAAWVMLELEDCPETPDPVKQKIYSLVVAKLQFAASLVRCDIKFTASQLARPCASVGPLHWAALHHVRGYRAENLGFNLKLSNLWGESKRLDCFTDSDWSITQQLTTGLLAMFNWGIVQWVSKM